MKRTLALLLAALTLLPLFAACNESDAPAETTTTTTATSAEPEKPKATSPFGDVGLESMHMVIDDYYDSRRHRLSSEPHASGDASVWGVASYIEALAETYRLYPDDKKTKNAYIDALDECLTRYEVSNTSIRTPLGNKTVTYYNATAGSSGDYYYDDDAWICIQFLNAYELLGDAKYLTKAEETLKFLWTGWDDVLGGGIYWDKTYSGKNTCDNGPIAISFLWAYQITQNADYLEKGKMIYDWTRETLLQDDLYCDGIGVDGNVNTWKAAYNQGVMLYAGAQLYEITGDETYYNDTNATFLAVSKLMFVGRGKTVKMNGNPIFKAWCIGWLVRGLMKYYSVDSRKNSTQMDNIATILQNVLATKDEDGFYDPYFLTGDWASESTTDIIQPCGMTSVFCLTHYFITEMKE